MATEIRGTTNAVAVPSLIAKEALRLLKNNLVMGELVNKTYQKDLTAKIGDTITIKLPARFNVNSGRTVSTYQPMVDETTTLVVNQQRNVPIRWTLNDQTLHIKEFSRRYLASAMSSIAHSVDKYIIDQTILGSFNGSGTPGTATVNNDIIDAIAYMENVGVPQDGMVRGVIGPLDAAAIQKDLKGTANDEIAMRAITKALIPGTAQAGAPFYRTAQMGVQQTGARGGVMAVNGTTADGATTLVVDGLTNSVTNWGLAGEVFTIGGVFEINPMTKASTGRLQRFVVTSNFSSSAGGAATISFSPAINAGTATRLDGDGNAVSTAAYQNVSALPADNAPVTFIGSAATTYRQVLMFHPDAIALACVDLELPMTAVLKERATDPDAGYSILFSGGWDVANFQNLTRLDILFGVKVVYPQLVHRLWSA